MEIGYDQERYVEDLFQSIPSFEKVTVRRDHAGLPRVAQARKIDQTLTK
jgi:methylase of polypeptide subunit release factors